MKARYKNLLLPIDVIEKVEEYQRDNYIKSFTQTVIQLLIKALKMK